MAHPSTRWSSPFAELPADQRTPEGEERRVNVGPPVIPHAEAAKLVQPRKRPLHDPPAQPTPLRGTTNSDPPHDMPLPQPTPKRNHLGVTGAYHDANHGAFSRCDMRSFVGSRCGEVGDGVRKCRVLWNAASHSPSWR